MTHSSPDIKIFNLPDGLRLVHRHEATETEYFGAAINAGSRDDPPGHEGLAHFVEHVLFKGTERRKSWHIINRMESCGGELNAYTTKETTVVYTIYPSGNFMRAADLLGDLLCHSVFPEKELNREREVVGDEISQYRDIPSEAVFDDFEDIIFKGSGLGHNILGNRETLTSFDTSTCRRYVKENFTRRRMVLFYAGPLRPEKVCRAAERFFFDLPEGTTSLARTPPPPVSPFDSTVNLSNHQANTLTGARIPSMYSDMRWSFFMLSNIIGGPGMNSLLNVELRERRGLVYAVDSTTAMLTDSGLMTIYFGCDHSDTSRCRRLITRVLHRLADNTMTDRFMNAARRQYLGQLTLSSDVRDNAVMSMARAVLYYGSVLKHDEVAARIRDISAQSLRDAAGSFLDSGLSALTLT
ncbi:MAG: insulinase family protein [Paramuribaculum sp.]|nr:insulinase family protein [Paramuribaculum sp.]